LKKIYERPVLAKRATLARIAASTSNKKLPPAP
jgi:hypothetical protein